MLGGFATTVHAAASDTWVRLLHARNGAALATSLYATSTPLAAARAEDLVAAPAFLSAAPAAIGGAPVQALCITAHHPGRDRYVHGALLAENVRAWAVAGSVLRAMEHRVREAGALTPALADDALQVAMQARTAWDQAATGGHPRRIVDRVVTILSERGYASVFSGGPHWNVAMHWNVALQCWNVA
jgi:hypothetical protein